MLERIVVLPKRDHLGGDNSGRIKEVERIVLEIAGGFSSVEQHGKWVDPATGIVDTDISERMSVICTPEQDAQIRERLAGWAVLLGQKGLYSHSARVSAQVVYPHTYRKEDAA